MRKRLYGLRPIVNDKTKVLILGSFPGKESLDKKEYYANKLNQFWTIMSDLLQGKSSLTNYKDKIDLLLRKKIGLWDVIKSCCRESSSDNAIADEELNDIKSFLRKYPNIKAIFLDGRKAEELFKRNGIDSLHIEYLPSTSSAYAKSFAFKKEKWGKILKFV